jgi:hypothetical protein
MSRRTASATAVLTLLLTALGAIVYTRGVGIRSGPVPAALAPPFTTEEAWVVDEIVRDITELSAFPGRAPDVHITADDQEPGAYRVAIGNGAPVDLDLRDALWSPSAFAAVARAAGTGAGSTPSAEVVPLHPLLVELTPPSLLTANTTVSRALQASPRSAAAHQSAALTIAGFALREPNGRMSDVRWAMNRVTAHLAMATAIGPAAASVDGRLAEAILCIFSGRQLRAMAIVDELDASASSGSVSAWTRALRIRLTDDWRQLADPRRATRLELREYFRARRATGQTTRATVELDQIGVRPDADWVRMISAYGRGVEDGWLVTDAMDFERAEYESVYEQMHGAPIGRDAIAKLNAPTTRAVVNGRLEVLPWGAWAEFAQRNLAAVIYHSDGFFRHTLALEHDADDAKHDLAQQWSGLWAFPYATMSWHKGSGRGNEGDTTYLKEAVDQLLAAPHRTPAILWAYIDTATRYEHLSRGVPPARSWFLRPQARTAYDVAARIENTGHPRSLEDMQRILEAAPFDYSLGSQYLVTKSGRHTALADIERLAGKRLEYDLRPMRAAMKFKSGGEPALELYQRMCEISASECAGFAWNLILANRPDDAARAYQRAFSDPTLDGVTMSHQTEWLVNYYHEHHRDADALKLAGRSAEVGSASGLLTAAHLYERLERFSDAEELYQHVRERYDDPAGLLGFYYRAVNVRQDASYERRWQIAREKVFPDDLVKTPPAAEKPARGVHVESGSASATAAGIRSGDIIVTVDGWRVEDVRQYHAVRAFPLDGGFTLTIWRTDGLHQVKIADKRFVPEFRVANYPLEGWVER